MRLVLLPLLVLAGCATARLAVVVPEPRCHTEVVHWSNPPYHTEVRVCFDAPPPSCPLDGKGCKK